MQDIYEIHITTSLLRKVLNAIETFFMTKALGNLTIYHILHLHHIPMQNEEGETVVSLWDMG